MIDNGKHDVLGIGIDAVDYEGAVARIVNAAQARQPMAVSALAVHGLMTGVFDREQRFRLNRFEMIVPDGQPVRWALNWAHQAKLSDRVYGPQLMLETCQAAADRGLPIFLFGGAEELLQQLTSKLTERFPKLTIAGTQASKFRCLTPDEKEETIANIRQSGAAICFIGLGCPRQEVWAYEFKEALSMPLLAVGAAFNFHAGLLAQAPPAMQKRGLEWLYRLTKEPTRLWKRYLLLNPIYASLLALQLAGLKPVDAAAGIQPKKEILYG